MNKRDFLALLAAGAAAPHGWAEKRAAKAAAPAPAPAPVPTPAPAPLAMLSSEPFVVAINEGATYRDSEAISGERFGDLAADLQKRLRRPIQLQLVRQYPELVEGLRQARYDLAYVHPAHHAIRAMKSDGYRLIALTKGFTDYRASFMVPANSPLKELADLKAVKVGGPAEDSITSVLARATLRDALGGQLPKMVYVRYQDAVPFMIEHNLCAVGVSASRAVVKDWQAKGGRVLSTSRPVPVKQLLASPKVTDAQRAELTAYFVGLEQSGEGQQRLRALDVPGFVEFGQEPLTAIGTWLGV